MEDRNEVTSAADSIMDEGELLHGKETPEEGTEDVHEYEDSSVSKKKSREKSGEKNNRMKSKRKRVRAREQVNKSRMKRTSKRASGRELL